MGSNAGVPPPYTRDRVEDLSDLTGINADVLHDNMSDPRQFTLSEVAELAPHLGMTPDEFVRSVLA